MDNPITVLATITGIVLAIFGGVFALILWAASIDCSSKAAVMQRQHQYGVWSGCMIKTNSSGWVPLSSYRVVE